MRVLVYKRTHNGDPDASGCFGAFDCMGTVRDREYDAVVGVGGIGPEAVSNGIDGRVNWIGIGPHKVYVDDKRGPEVMFDHFRYYGTAGPDFRALAPALAERMYTNNIRSILGGLSAAELADVLAIVQQAADWPSSPGLAVTERISRAVVVCGSQTPNQALQQTAGACSVSGIRSSLGPRRC